MRQGNIYNFTIMNECTVKKMTRCESSASTASIDSTTSVESTLSSYEKSTCYIKSWAHWKANEKGSWMKVFLILSGPFLFVYQNNRSHDGMLFHIAVAEWTCMDKNLFSITDANDNIIHLSIYENEHFKVWHTTLREAVRLTHEHITEKNLLQQPLGKKYKGSYRAFTKIQQRAMGRPFSKLWSWLHSSDIGSE